MDSIGSVLAIGATEVATSRMSTRVKTPTRFAPSLWSSSANASSAVSGRDGVVDEQHSPAGDRGSADAWFVVLVPDVAGFADEREGEVAGQRDGGGERDATGLGADDDVHVELMGEGCTWFGEVVQQPRVAVGVLVGEWVQGQPGLHVPVRDAGPDQARHGGEPGDEVGRGLGYGGEAGNVGVVGEPGPPGVRQGQLVRIHTIHGRAGPRSSRPWLSLVTTLEAPRGTRSVQLAATVISTLPTAPLSTAAWAAAVSSRG